MAGIIAARLTELGIELPKVAAPAGAYVPYTLSGKILFVSGQIPMRDGSLTHKGKVGTDVSVEEGHACARVCALNILAQVAAACGGDLDKVARCLKLGGFVNSTATFTDQPEVVNGCSDLMVEVFGERGRHARAAVSAPSLPRGVAVEIEAIFEIA